MLYDLPRDPAPSDLPSDDMVSATSASAGKGKDPVTLSSRRNALNVHIAHREVPNYSKHCVSPSALAAALREYKMVASPDSNDAELDTVADEKMRRYKRARIDETTARLQGRPVLPEAGPSNMYRGKEEKSSHIKVDEDSYWSGAFSQDETLSSNITRKTVSRSARRVHFGCGHNAILPADWPTTGLVTADADRSVTLPHRPHHAEVTPETSIVADLASEDEGFAMIHRSQATADVNARSPMASPEMVPAMSIAETMSDDKAGSDDDDWTLV